jgi:small-conductance mechanosensitive channel/CRP-like cAMP-binding protein
LQHHANNRTIAKGAIGGPALLAFSTGMPGAAPRQSGGDDMTANLIPAAVLLAIALVGVLGLRRFSQRVRIVFDILCFLAISLYFWRQGALPLFPPLSGSPDSAAIWLRAVGGAWWLLGARIAVASLRFVVQHDRGSRGARLFSDLSAASIYIATAAVVLSSVFALPVTGVLATSGVVAIVLGLALQNTLADVFAGIAVGIEAPFGVGDRIQIGDRIEGRVVQMNWRSIRVQTDGDDVAIIPNSIMAKAEIINRSFPSQRRASSVEFSCPESAVPERVIETLLHATLLCPNILVKPAPGAVLTRVGSKRNFYKISFVVDSTMNLSPTKDLLLRAARRQLHYAGFLDQSRERETLNSNATGDALAARRLLHDLVLFEGLDDRQIDGLADLLVSHRLEPEDELFAQGATDASLYIVVSGILQFTRRTEAASKIIGCIGAGEYVGEIGLLTGAPHATTAIARTHCRVHQLPREAIAPLLKENADLAFAFEKSARRGLDLLNRAVAVGDTPGIGAKGQLLLRIRSFFHFGPE